MSNLPKRKGELVQEPSGDGWTVYEAETDSLHVLNDSARAIWELCDGETTPEEMADAVAELTELDREAAVEQVAAALRALQDARLVDYDMS